MRISETEHRFLEMSRDMGSLLGLIDGLEWFYRNKWDDTVDCQIQKIIAFKHELDEKRKCSENSGKSAA